MLFKNATEAANSATKQFKQYFTAIPARTLCGQRNRYFVVSSCYDKKPNGYEKDMQILWKGGIIC